MLLVVRVVQLGRIVPLRVAEHVTIDHHAVDAVMRVEPEGVVAEVLGREIGHRVVASPRALADLRAPGRLGAGTAPGGRNGPRRTRIWRSHQATPAQIPAASPPSISIKSG